MDYMKPLVVSGTVTRVGSVLVSISTREIATVEIAEDNGNVISINNFIVPNKMAKYIATGQKATIHFVSMNYLHSIPGKKWWYVYAIDTQNHRLEDWPYDLKSAAQFRIVCFVVLTIFILIITGCILRENDGLFELLWVDGAIAIPLFMLFRSMRRTVKLIRVIENHLNRKSNAKKGARTARIILPLICMTVLGGLLKYALLNK